MEQFGNPVIHSLSTSCVCTTTTAAHPVKLPLSIDGSLPLYQLCMYNHHSCSSSRTSTLHRSSTLSLPVVYVQPPHAATHPVELPLSIGHLLPPTSCVCTTITATHPVELPLSIDRPLSLPVVYVQPPQLLIQSNFHSPLIVHSLLPVAYCNHSCPMSSTSLLYHSCATQSHPLHSTAIHSHPLLCPHLLPSLP